MALTQPSSSQSANVGKMARDNPFLEIYQRLFAHFGPQSWWPGDTAIEIVVGAILTQNTNWTNVSKAITNLKNADLLNFASLDELDVTLLAELIRPSGYYNMKAVRLKNFFRMVRERYEGELDLLLGDSMRSARENLLSVRGIGPETADSILLYAGNHPVFVIDAYTYRIFLRHFLLSETSDYHEVQETFTDNLPQDVQLFNEYHALIVHLGKHFCKKTKPLCENCPLQDFPHQTDV